MNWCLGIILQNNVKIFPMLHKIMHCQSILDFSFYVKVVSFHNVFDATSCCDLHLYRDSKLFNETLDEQKYIIDILNKNMKKTRIIFSGTGGSLEPLVNDCNYIN